MENFKENFGLQGKDVITGFEGIITGYLCYISGCAQYLLTPPVNEKGEVREAQWFDTSRVQIGDLKITLPKEKVAEAPGPDKAAPTSYQFK